MRVIGPTVGILWLVGGLVQLFAVIEGIQYWIGIPEFLAVLLSVVLSFFPLLGSILCLIGALNVWQWPWWGAVLLTLPQIIVFAVAALGQVAQKEHVLG